MKRDMDLCRIVLDAIETKPGVGPAPIEIADYSQEEVSYQVMILAEGGYLNAYAYEATTRAGLLWKPSRLTWQGHEFLDAIRNESVWIKVKHGRQVRPNIEAANLIASRRI